MSFQINASYSEELHFEDIPKRKIYALLLKGIQRMGWSRAEITEHSITAYAGLSLTSFGEVIHMEINHSVVYVTSTCLMPQIWSVGKNKRNIRKLGRRINWLEAHSPEDELMQAYMAASVEFIATDHPTGEERFRNVVESAGKISGVLSIFNPKPGYFITPILIDLNIFIFLLLGLAGAGFWMYNLHGFEYLGANATDLVLNRGQWWRLFTYQFLHAGFFHLIGNMFALLMIGVYLEPILGRARFLLYYLICGVIGGLLGNIMHPFIYSVGASGAIFGMYGVFLGLLTSNLIEKHSRKAILSTLVFFIGLHLLAGLQDQVDNSAHIGGIIAGFLLGKISVGHLRKNNPWQTAKNLTAAVLAAVLITILSIQYMPNQPGAFRVHLLQFAQNEKLALSYLDKMEVLSDEELIREIEYQSLGFWKQSAADLDQLDQLKIGHTGHARVQTMRNYVWLQVQKASLELFWIVKGRPNNDYVERIRQLDLSINDLEYELGNTNWTFQ